MDIVRHASIGFLAPVFFVTAGFAVTLDVVSTSPLLLFGLIGLAMVGKIVGTMLFYSLTGFGWREGLTLGAGMNGRGAVEIIIAQIGLTMGVISQEIFSILVFMAITTTATVPFSLKWCVDWLQRRGELVRSDDDRKGVLILGAGPTARRLGVILADSQPVWIVDQNPDQCALAEAEGLEVVRGNTLDEEVLSQAHASEARHVIAMTRNGEVNVLAAQLAKTEFLVPEIHVLDSGGLEGHKTLLEHIGGTTAFGGTVNLSDWDYFADHSEIEQFGIPIAPGLSTGSNFDKLQRGQQTLPLAVRRGEKHLPFHSGLRLQKEDRLIVLQLAQPEESTYDRFDWLVSQSPIVDVDSALSLDGLFTMAAESMAPRLEIDKDRLADLFHNREASTSTVLLPGLAVPHVSVDGSGMFELFIVRCRDGIRFPQQDDPVRAAFVLASSSDERTFHLRTLSAIAQIIQGSDFERNWLSAPDEAALRELLLRAKRKRLPAEPEPPWASG
jgi:mannitol/fructose-specific phosphotransferase system IIA component (Ntr-type)